MSFKETVIADLETFMSLEEFAEMHLLEGSEVLCSVDSEEFKERAGVEEFGVMSYDITIYAKTNDLKDGGIYERGYGSLLNVDNKEYTVILWSENAGMTCIKLTKTAMN